MLSHSSHNLETNSSSTVFKSKNNITNISISCVIAPAFRLISFWKRLKIDKIGFYLYTSVLYDKGDNGC